MSDTTRPSPGRPRSPADPAPASPCKAKRPPPAPPSARIATCWLITAVAALSLAGVYIAGGQPQIEGALLLVALGSLGIGFILLARKLLPGSEVTGPRHDMGSSLEAQEAVETSFAAG